MEFKDVLEQRRSVRSYRDTPVERPEIQALLDAAILAPSATNSQPWEFWVIEGRSKVDDLANRAKRWLLDRIAENPTAAAVDQRQHLAPKDMSIFYHAPTLVLVVAKAYGKQADEDCCLAASSLMLAARNAGIGTCWIGSSREWFNQHAMKTELGIPSGDNIVAPIVMGYPQEWPEPHGRNAAIIHWVS